MTGLLALTTVEGPAKLDDPLYYLHNFRWVLNWVVERHGDLLEAYERQFVATFHALPVASQGLLVRMVMRKGTRFRADKLSYAELGNTRDAVAPLIKLGWVDPAPELDIAALFDLFTWPQLQRLLARQLGELGLAKARKGEARAALVEQGWPPAKVADWGAPEHRVYELTLMHLCDRFRLMFFGNLHQDWSEFVLTELGTYQYELVEFSHASRPFQSRAEIDAYIQLYACRERFYDAEPLVDVAADLPTIPVNSPWLKRSYDRLAFKLAREWERAGAFVEAQALYQHCGHPEARTRWLRVLERRADYQQALDLATIIKASPKTEAEWQQVERVLPRIRRKLGLASERAIKPAAPAELALTLPVSASVEVAVKEHFESAQTRVHYVENTLFLGLFGLLCWDAVFAPLPGAFFHPFQRGPADLHWPDFYERRAPYFTACLAKLDGDDYRQHILTQFREKQGVQSHFLFWGCLSEELLVQALNCIPADHLKRVFERLLGDIKANSAGFPDLIQLWPNEGRYRMIEVKGPGDRLQDNQLRWLHFFARHAMPAAVCYVNWQARQ